MTVQELIAELQQYDPELEIKAESQFGERFELDHLWQWDNSKDEPILNTYLTLEIIEQ